MSGLIRAREQRAEPPAAPVWDLSVWSDSGVTTAEVFRRLTEFAQACPPIHPRTILGYPVVEVGDPTVPVGHPDYRPAPVQIPSWDPSVDRAQQATMNRQHFDWEYWGPYLRAGAPYGDTEEGCRRWSAEREALRYQPDVLPAEDNPGLRFVPFDDPSAVVGTSDPGPSLGVADLKVTIRADASAFDKAFSGLRQATDGAAAQLAVHLARNLSVTIDELHKLKVDDVQLIADMWRMRPWPTSWATTHANEPADKPASMADVLTQKRSEQHQRQQDQARPGHRFRPHRQQSLRG